MELGQWLMTRLIWYNFCHWSWPSYHNWSAMGTSFDLTSFFSLTFWGHTQLNCFYIDITSFHNYIFLYYWPGVIKRAFGMYNYFIILFQCSNLLFMLCFSNDQFIDCIFVYITLTNLNSALNDFKQTCSLEWLPLTGDVSEHSTGWLLITKLTSTG